MLQEESSEAIELLTADRKVIRIDRDDVEEFQPSPTSVMPSGLAQQLTVRELSDLVAFLLDAK